MKTKSFISKLRAATGVAVQLVFALLLIMLPIINYFGVQNFLLRFWPIGASILLAYAVLSLAEDYLNSRIVYRNLHFS